MEAPLSFSGSDLPKRSFGMKAEEKDFATLTNVDRTSSAITYCITDSPNRSGSSQLPLPVKRYAQGTSAESLTDSRNALNNAIAVVKSELSAATRQEYPVKSQQQHYATSILKGTTWTVQSQQNNMMPTYSSPSHHSAKIISRSYNSTSHSQPQTRSVDSKSTTLHGVTASWERPRQTIAVPTTSGSYTYYDGGVEEQVYEGLEEDVGRVGRWLNKQVDSSTSRYVDDIERNIKNVRKNYPVEHSTYQKPGWSYSSLIALALKNSDDGHLTVAEIYAFVLENFPYFRTAPAGWKNSVRHNLSLNKCFKKVDTDPSDAQTTRKSCLWMISPDRMEKVEQDIRKWRERNPDPAAHGLARPQDLFAIEEGTKGLPSMDVLHKHSSRPTQYAYDTLTSSRAHTAYSRPQRTVTVPTVKPDPIRDEVDLAVHHILYDSPSSDDTPLSPLHPSTMDEDFEPGAFEDSFQGPFKRPYSAVLCSPSKGATDFLALIRPHDPVTPPKNDAILGFDFSLSPLRYHGCSGGFDTAHSALNDNSLMTAALGLSPYKGPVTFPAF